MEVQAPSRRSRLMRMLSVGKMNAQPQAQYAHALKEQRLRRMNGWNAAELKALRQLVDEVQRKTVSLPLAPKYSGEDFATHADEKQRKHLDYPSWRKSFYRTPINKRQVLSRRGFQRLFPNLKDVNRAAMQRVVHMFDCNASGRIEFSEICEHLYRAQYGALDTNIVFIFEWFKDEGSAVIGAAGLELMIQTANELRSLVAHLKTPFSNNLVQELLAGQKTMTLDDFRERFKQWGLLEALLKPFDIVRPTFHEDELLKQYASLRITAEDVVYLVSKQWWSAWLEYMALQYPNEFAEIMQGNEEAQLSKTSRLALLHRPGPIDNRDICEDEYLGTLKQDLKQNQDFVALPWSIWHLLSKVYPGGPEFARRVRAVQDDGSLEVDLYPLVLFVRVAKHDATRVNLLLARKFFLPPSTTILDLVRRFGIRHGENAEDVSVWIRHTKFDLWQRLECDLDSPVQTLEQLHITSSDELLIDFIPIDQYDDSSSSNASSDHHPRDPNVFDVAVYRPVGNDFVSAEKGLDMFFRSGSWNPLADELIQQKESAFTTKPSAAGATSLSGPSAGGVFVDLNNNAGQRFKSRLIQRTGIRATGLINMGNTCFMNCALQCIGHSPILREYFVSRRFEQDINRKNILGTAGAIANAYGRLMEAMWNEREHAFLMPADFRDDFTMYRRHFQEARQHDAHEFIVSLLDSLHEDLNMKDTPATESYGLLQTGNPASDGDDGRSSTSSETHPASLTSDDAMGSLSWEAYTKRNASVIVDLFHGQLRNETVCGTCGERRSSFDPYLFFSVPLPESKFLRLDLRIIRQARTLEGEVHNRIIRAAYWSKRGEKGLTLLERVGADFELHPNRMILVSVRGNRIRRILNREDIVDNLSMGGELYIYERAWKLDEIPTATAPLECLATDEADSMYKVSSFEEIKLGSRLDGLSLNGEWGSGTIVDQSEEANDSGNKGHRVCMRFDAMGPQWNRWFSREDWAEERLLPLHTKTSTTPEVFEVQVIHRYRNEFEDATTVRPLYRTYADAMNARPRSPRAENADKFCFELFGTPLFATVASNKTTLDLYFAIVLQVARFTKDLNLSQINCPLKNNSGLSQDDKRKCVEAFMQALPFKMRIVNLEDVGYSTGQDMPVDSTCVLQHFSNRSVVALDWSDCLLFKAEEQVLSDTPAPEMEEGDESASPTISLESCLDELMKAENMSLDDHWMCEKCGTFSEATRRSDIWRLPDLVMIQLKRFQYFDNHHRQKVRSFVDFPLRGLDFSKWMGPSQLVRSGRDNNGPDSQEFVYDLYAVANHVGSLSRGHYTAFCRYDGDFEESSRLFKTPSAGEVHCKDIWFRFDDERVLEVSDRDVVSEAAYVLFYKRRNFSANNLVQYSL